ncbi:MAG: hypothetical protein QOI63_1034 [Thermoplasmata archaeon]|jgi:hypothetical protein|nr:hypothetical protein [Thermoplasmata archaeon]
MDETADGAPRLPEDLPPLPSRFYKARPHRLACRQCDRHFATAEELNEHVRRTHLPEAGAAKGHGH